MIKYSILDNTREELSSNITVRLDDTYFKVGTKRVENHIKTLDYTPKISYDKVEGEKWKIILVSLRDLINLPDSD